MSSGHNCSAVRITIVRVDQVIQIYLMRAKSPRYSYIGKRTIQKNANARRARERAHTNDQKDSVFFFSFFIDETKRKNAHRFQLIKLHTIETKDAKNNANRLMIIFLTTELTHTHTHAQAACAPLCGHASSIRRPHNAKCNNKKIILISILLCAFHFRVDGAIARRTPDAFLSLSNIQIACGVYQTKSSPIVITLAIWIFRSQSALSNSHRMPFETYASVCQFFEFALC